MTIGISGDTPANTPQINVTDSTSNNLPGSAIPAATDYLQGNSGQFDVAREDIPGRVITADYDLMLAILTELRTITYMLAEGLNVSTDPDVYRTDPGLDAQMN